MLEIRASHRVPPPSPVYFSLIELRSGAEIIVAIPINTDAFKEDAPSHLVREGTSWGEVDTYRGRQAIPFLNYGSPFHKVAAVFSIPDSVRLRSQRDLSIRLTYCTESRCELTLHLVARGKEMSLGLLPP